MDRIVRIHVYLARLRALTLGTKTRQRVAVVQNIMKTEIRMNEASFRSDNTIEIAAPVTHMITTL